MALAAGIISTKEVEKMNVVGKSCFGNDNVKTMIRQVSGWETLS